MPVEIKMSIEDKEVRSLLEQIQRRTGDLSPAMKIIGETVKASIERNFERGGRPQKWAALSAATIVQRMKRGKWPGQILVQKGVSGGLLGSLNYQISANRAVISAGKKYAAIQHFGGQAGRGGKVKLPARPFLLVQDEDWREIERQLADYITGGRR